MRSALVSAAMVGVLHMAVPAVEAAPLGRVVAGGEGADGGRGATVVRGGSAGFLAGPDVRQSPLVAVGEGGEGGKGRRWRRDRRYGYVEPWRYRAEPYPYHWGPPPRAYLPPPRRAWQPEPSPYVYEPRPPSVGVWIDPGS
jgi:hypothetical protein